MMMFRGNYVMIVLFKDQLTHGALSSQIPQVFPGASLMNPFYPQVVPQEFLIL